MAEYIDKQKLLKYLEETNTADEWIANQYNADWIYSFIESQPTADVAEVVRCKDCKYGTIAYGCLKRGKGLRGDFVKPTDFCSYGERKGELENDR